MIIYPAIDIKKSKCVRLYQGNYARETIYEIDPVSRAKQYYNEGATWLHVVDLDGADNPTYNQFPLISDIIRSTNIKVQTGGGIRSKEQIKSLLNIGAERVIVGSMAVQYPNEVSKWLSYFGADRIVLALDIIYNTNNQPIVTSNAWKDISEYSLFNIIDNYASYGLKNILCTNILLDGTFKGPDYNLYKQLMDRFPHLCVQASGGVQSINDISLLREKGLSGAIIGRALYENKFTLTEVLAC